jgi:hypothetical protein
MFQPKGAIGFVLTTIIVSIFVTGCGGGASNDTDALAWLLTRMPAERSGVVVVPRPAESLNRAVQWLEDKGETEVLEGIFIDWLEETNTETQQDTVVGVESLLEEFGIDLSRPVGFCFVSLDHFALAYCGWLCRGWPGNGPTRGGHHALYQSPAGAARAFHDAGIVGQ